MVNTRQFSGSTYMQDMTKSHTFSAKNQGSTYTPIRLIRREIQYFTNSFDIKIQDSSSQMYMFCNLIVSYTCIVYKIIIQ